MANTASSLFEELNQTNLKKNNTIAKSIRPSTNAIASAVKKKSNDVGGYSGYVQKLNERLRAAGTANAQKTVTANTGNFSSTSVNTDQTESSEASSVQTAQTYELDTDAMAEGADAVLTARTNAKLRQKQAQAAARLKQQQELLTQKAEEFINTVASADVDLGSLDYDELRDLAELFMNGEDDDLDFTLEDLVDTLLKYESNGDDNGILAVDTNDSATGNFWDNLSTKLSYAVQMMDPYSIESYVDQFEEQYRGNTSESAWEKAYAVLKTLDHYTYLDDDEIKGYAEEFLDVMYDGDVPDYSGDALTQFYGVDDVEETNKQMEKAQKKTDNLIQSGQYCYDHYGEDSYDEQAARIVFDAYYDGGSFSDMMEIADRLASSEYSNSTGTDAKSNLMYYLTWKDPEITAMDKINNFGTNVAEGAEDALEGMGTTIMKVVGLEEFVPESWSQPDFDKKLVEDTKDEMGWLGDFVYDLGYTAGNLAPTIVANAILPGSGLAVTFVGTAGQSYNQAIMAGHTEDEAVLYGLLNGAVSTLTERVLGVFGKSVGAGNAITKMSSFFDNALSRVITNKAARAVVTNMISSGTGEFIEEYLEQMLSPVIENLSFDGEEFTFQENPMQVFTKENAYAGLMGAIFGAVFGGVETANKLNAAGTISNGPLNTDGTINTNENMNTNETVNADENANVTSTTSNNVTATDLVQRADAVRVSGEAMGVSDKNIRYAQDLANMSGFNVEFTADATHIDGGTIYVNKDTYHPVSEAVELMTEEGIKTKLQQQTQANIKGGVAYDYEALSKLNDGDLRTVFDTMRQAYAKTLTKEQADIYLRETGKTKIASQMVDTIRSMQSDMGLKENVRVGADETNGLENGDGDGRIDVGDERSAKVYGKGAELPKKILETKPLYSPNVDKWLNNGGKIAVENGEWTYINPQGISVVYKNGYPDFKYSGHVMQEVDIGSFKNRSSDFKLADETAPNGPKSPDSTWHHHEDGKTLQEVNRRTHAMFTHKGGISLGKKGGK